MLQIKQEKEDAGYNQHQYKPPPPYRPPFPRAPIGINLSTGEPVFTAGSKHSAQPVLVLILLSFRQQFCDFAGFVQSLCAGKMTSVCVTICTLCVRSRCGKRCVSRCRSAAPAVRSSPGPGGLPTARPHETAPRCSAFPQPTAGECAVGCVCVRAVSFFIQVSRLEPTRVNFHPAQLSPRTLRLIYHPQGMSNVAPGHTGSPNMSQAMINVVVSGSTSTPTARPGVSPQSNMRIMVPSTFSNTTVRAACPKVTCTQRFCVKLGETQSERGKTRDSEMFEMYNFVQASGRSSSKQPVTLVLTSKGSHISSQTQVGLSFHTRLKTFQRCTF